MTQSNTEVQSERVPGENDIMQSLETCENSQITDLLYDFGSQLVRDVNERVNWLDTKASVFAGFAGALIVVVISTFSSWQSLAKDQPAAAIVLFLGLLSLLLAAWSAIRGLRVRSFEGFHEKLWFAKEYFLYPDRLKRYYLIGMYRVVKSHDQINEQKARLLKYTERLVVAGATLLAIPLLVETWQLGIGRELTALLDLLRWWGL